MLLIIILLLPGCSKQDDLPDKHIFKTGLDSDSHFRLREDPYDIHNILKAYKNLQAGDSSVPTFDIKPNHIYLRFFPRDENELELLKKDTTLILYDYPLNSEISEGEFSINSESDDSHVSCQYCVVPVGKELPAVNYEVIYEVFLPPAEDFLARSTQGDQSAFYEKLVNESARITGNLSDEDTSACMTARSSQGRWSPGGRIRVWDDILGMYIPLEHVNVHARWFTHVETALTDSEGNFRMKRFSHPVNYSVKWENSLFTIRDGLFFQAWYNGPKKKGDWMLDISGGKSKMFATMHRAAYRQFYGDNLGLFRPVLNTGGRTKICYMDGKGTGQFNGDFSGVGILPDIQVWGNKATEQTNIIFATVTHELGHQLHSQYIGNLRYMKVSRIIRESWAEAVEWAITNDEYHKLGKKYGVQAALRYDQECDNHSGWPLVPDRNYSPAFIDLVDDFNQCAAYGPEYPNDLISQYTLSYINRYILRNITDISSLREEVSKHKLEGVDDFKVHELYLLY